MFDFSMLNDEQREAVRDFDHNLLILACAGSGKTRTITQKIAYAVSEGIYRPYQILAVTFTNRAAEEMRSRIADTLPDTDLSGMEMRTFHSFGAYILRRFGMKAGLSPSFCIYDDDDSLQLLSSCVKLEKKDLRQVQKAISKAKDRGMTPDSPGLTELLPDFDLPSIFQRYEEALAASGNADFADLILKSTWLLENDEETRTEMQRPSRFLREIPQDMIAADLRSSVSQKPYSSIVNTPSWASGISFEKPKVQKVKPRNEYGTFSVGDDVTNPEFGRGKVIEIDDKGEGRRVITVRFGKSTAKFIEAFAKLEKS